MQEINNIEKNKNYFNSLLRSTNRDGIEDLIRWLESTDFYTAPASSRFHGAFEGGLVLHSLNVFYCLKAKKHSALWQKTFTDYNISDETIILISLLHDVCKANFYVDTWKNQKTYDEDKVKAAPHYQVKHDNGGDFIWETVKGYSIDEQFTYGHGEKSVYLINKYITLSDEEAVAVRFHMGAFEGQNMWNNLSKAFEKFPIALALHEADMEASYILEANGAKQGLLT